MKAGVVGAGLMGGRPGWPGENRGRKNELERNEAMSEAKGPRDRGRCRP